LPKDLKEIEEFINSINGLIEWYSAMDEVFLDKIHQQQEKKKIELFDQIKNKIKSYMKLVNLDGQMYDSLIIMNTAVAD
jgi:hypothetical protein